MTAVVDRKVRILECKVIYRDDPKNRCGCLGYEADRILNQLGGP